MTVSEQAVEAALRAFYKHTAVQNFPRASQDQMERALEAALPLMGVHATDRTAIKDAVRVGHWFKAFTEDEQVGATEVNAFLAEIADAVLSAQSGSRVMRREDVARVLEAALESARERLATISTGRLPNDPYYNAEKFFNWVIEYARLGFNDAEVALCETALHTGQPVEGCGTEVTVGLGLVDIGPIKHEGRHGVLIRPRKTHIPYGEPGELQNTEYWPRKGDVTIWIDGEGPQVLITELNAFLSAAPASPQKREGE